MKEKGKKLNNKGFSLVEIIIVIAVMAVLTGIIAPQIMSYVEESREAKDLQLVNSIFTAVQTAFAVEPPTADIDDETITNVVASYTKISTFLGTDLDTVGEVQGKAKSKRGKAGTLYIDYKESTGELKVYIGSAKGTATIGPVSNK